MAKIECQVCGAENPVLRVCCGPGVPSTSDPTKLDCPAGPQHGSVDIPKHCGKPMKYTE